MKIRSGFVSNSSSSSFIILGSSTAPLDRAQTVELLKTNPDARILVVGASMNEGNDVFFLDKRMIDFILDHEERFLASFAEWKAYVDPVKFIPDPRESWGYEGPEEDEVFLKENEQVIYKDYNSESEDDFSFFVNQYFLTSDEYSTYMDWYWGQDLGKSSLGVIVYTEKTEDPNIPEDWADVYIGINEFAGYEGVGLFSSKKLTEGDLKRLRSGKLALKDGVSFYRDFQAVNKNKKIAHFREGDYNIIMMDSYFDKVKSLKYFLEEKNED